MANLKDLKELAIHSVKGTVPANFTADSKDVDSALREEIKALAGTYDQWRRGAKYDVFEIIQAVADVEVPNRVLDIFGVFAEIQFGDHGQRFQFKKRVGKQRAKSFITRAAVSGVYSAFRLDYDVYDVEPIAYGIAAYIDFERFLAGQENMAEYMDIIVEALVDSVFNEVQAALQASVSATRPTNTVYSNTYSAAELAKLVNTVKAYGNGAVVFAAPEFIANMGVDAIPVGTGSTTTTADSDVEDYHRNGKVSIFRGTPIVEMPQSFTDIDNATKVVSPKYAYIFPTGGEKVVKIAMEGQTIVKDWENKDGSFEIQAYRKFGVAIHSYHNWAVYYNSSLT